MCVSTAEQHRRRKEKKEKLVRDDVWMCRRLPKALGMMNITTYYCYYYYHHYHRAKMYTTTTNVLVQWKKERNNCRIGIWRKEKKEMGHCHSNRRAVGNKFISRFLLKERTRGRVRISQDRFSLLPRILIVFFFLSLWPWLVSIVSSRSSSHLFHYKFLLPSFLSFLVLLDEKKNEHVECFSSFEWPHGQSVSFSGASSSFLKLVV